MQQTGADPQQRMIGNMIHTDVPRTTQTAYTNADLGSF